jgi:predicted alpha/beta-fold hydrolase
MCSSDDLPGTSFIHAAIKRGWKVVVHNRPGHSSPLKTPRWSLFGDWRDVDVVVKHIRKKFPTRHVAAIGFSAGAFPLLKYLGETGVHSGLDAAVCVSGSVKLADSLEQCSWLFMKIFLHEGKKFFLKANEKILRDHDTLAYDRVMATTNARDFMTACVPFITGIQGCYDWTIGKSLLCPYSTIQHIDTPVLFLNAVDDPIVPPASIQPYEENVFRTNPNLLLAISATGSHCPFLHGCFSPEDYSMKTCLEFVAHQAAIVRLRKTAKAAAMESTRRVSYTEKKRKKMTQGGGGEEQEEEDFVSPRTSTLRKRYTRVPLATVATNTDVTK